MKIVLSIGDVSASNYIYNIFREGFDTLDIYGITDKKLESIGIRSIGSIEDISGFGLFEIVPKLRKIWKVKRNTEKNLKDADILIVCDAPGFNLPLIKKAKKYGVKRVIYFISPQVWAWKENRIYDIVNFADHLIVILPFEAEIYKKFEGSHFKVHYVGHPLVDLAKPHFDEKEFSNITATEGDRVGIFPGSRESEIKRMTPYLCEVYIRVFLDRNITGMVPTFKKYKHIVSQYCKEGIKVFYDEEYNLTYDIMRYSKFSLITSGTASLEALLLENPHIVFYRINPFTYFVAKMVVKSKYISLPNIITGREIVPEVIQKDVDFACAITEDYLGNERWRNEFYEASGEVRRKLGEKGVIEKLRNLFFELIYRNSSL